MFDFIVVGKGLMGAATGRYLSEWGAKVAIVGPDEPTDHTSHEGVFASHYDQGRLARLLSRDITWARLAKQAISQYGDIEARSGVRFHEPVGVLLADKPEAFEQRVVMAQAVAAEYQYFAPGDLSWRERFADLAFPAGYGVMVEGDPAGYINPRAYLQAQLTLAQKAQATLVSTLVINITRHNGHFTVSTAGGDPLTGRQVIVSAGAFTNFNGLLPRPIPLCLKTETIILGRVSAEDGQRLQHAPTVIYAIDDPDIDDIYMAPAIRYPDGQYYIKMGCNTTADFQPTTLPEVQAWFRSGDSDTCKGAMSRALQSLWPQVAFEGMRTHRCIVCYTPSGYPMIDEVEPGIWVVTGGNGTGASKADGIGYLAAGQILRGEWLLDVSRGLFEIEG